MLGAEPRHADRELVEWEDWDLLRDRSRAPGVPRSSRGLPRYRPRDRRCLLAGRGRCRLPQRRSTGPRSAYRPEHYGGFLRDPRRQQRRGASRRTRASSAQRLHRPPLDPRPRPRCVAALPTRRSRRTQASVSATTNPVGCSSEGEGHSLSLIDDERPRTEHVHIAFSADQDATVRAFHAAALAAGYDDNGGPGERPAYHPGYYGAFVFDPDGNNVEVVNHNW